MARSYVKHLAWIVPVVAVVACGSPRVNQGAVSPASGSATPAAAKPTEMPTWGKRYTWSSGLAVELSTPAVCKPLEYAQPPNIQRAVKVSVTVINGSGQAYDTTGLVFGVDAQFDGKKAQSVTDVDGPCGGGMDSTTVLPGKTFTGAIAFAVGVQPGELQIVLTPDFGSDRAVFVGPA